MSLMSINLLSALFYDYWDIWQGVVFLIVLIVLGLLILAVLFFLVYLICTNEEYRAARYISWYKKRLEKEEKALEMEEITVMDLVHSNVELKKKRADVEKAESEAYMARQKMLKQQQDLAKLFEQQEMYKHELAEYQKREGTYVAEDFIINILTERTLNDSKYYMDPKYSDCKIPLSKITEFTATEITSYICRKEEVEIFAGEGKKPTRYKVNGKVFAIINFDLNKKIKMSFKCGPDYAAKLKTYFKNNVSDNKFPYGLIWFCITNEAQPCSLELVKQLIDISYKIAKLGY